MSEDDMNEDDMNDDDSGVESVSGFEYESVTDNIRVQVQPIYLAEQSEPDKQQYVWAYRVRIINEGDSTIQLLNRHWEIVDSTGRKFVVDGEGVVGVQPTLAPQEAFEYTSGTPLSTPSGFMRGFYRMEIDGSDKLDVIIPPFVLESPYISATRH